MKHFSSQPRKAPELDHIVKSLYSGPLSQRSTPGKLSVLLPELLKRSFDLDYSSLQSQLKSFPSNRYVVDRNIAEPQLLKLLEDISQSGKGDLSTMQGRDLIHEEFKVRVFEYESDIFNTIQDCDVFKAFQNLVEWTRTKPTAFQYKKFVVHLQNWCRANPRLARKMPKMGYDDFILVVDRWFLEHRPDFMRINPVHRLSPQTQLLLILTITKDYLILRKHQPSILIDKKLASFTGIINKLFKILEEDSLSLKAVSISEQIAQIVAVLSSSKARLTDALNFYDRQLGIIDFVKEEKNEFCIQTPRISKFEAACIKKSKTFRSKANSMIKSRLIYSNSERRLYSQHTSKKCAGLSGIEFDLLAALINLKNRMLDDSEPPESVKNQILSIRSRILAHWNRFEGIELSSENFDGEDIKKEVFLLKRLKVFQQRLIATNDDEETRITQGHIEKQHKYLIQHWSVSVEVSRKKSISMKRRAMDDSGRGSPTSESLKTEKLSGVEIEGKYLNRLARSMKKARPPKTSVWKPTNDSGLMQALLRENEYHPGGHQEYKDFRTPSQKPRYQDQEIHDRQQESLFPIQDENEQSSEDENTRHKSELKAGQKLKYAHKQNRAKIGQSDQSFNLVDNIFRLEQPQGQTGTGIRTPLKLAQKCFSKYSSRNFLTIEAFLRFCDDYKISNYLPVETQLRIFETSSSSRKMGGQEFKKALKKIASEEQILESKDVRKKLYKLLGMPDSAGLSERKRRKVKSKRLAGVSKSNR